MNKQETNIENLLPRYIDGKTNQALSDDPRTAAGL